MLKRSASRLIFGDCGEKALSGEEPAEAHPSALQSKYCGVESRDSCKSNIYYSLVYSANPTERYAR